MAVGMMGFLPALLSVGVSAAGLFMSGGQSAQPAPPAPTPVAPPPTPVSASENADAKREAQRQEEARRQSFDQSKTIKTSPTGISEEEDVKVTSKKLGS